MLSAVLVVVLVLMVSAVLVVVLVALRVLVPRLRNATQRPRRRSYAAANLYSSVRF